jgi:hypothetical protein
MQLFLIQKESFTFVKQNFSMIQRIQTIYLLIASILSGGIIFTSALWENSLSQEIFALDLLQQEGLTLKAIPTLYILSAIVPFIAIFLFKNRQLQFVLGRLTLLINLILLGILIYVSQTLPGEMQVSEKGIGMFIPVVVILLIVLANKAIKKDENLVKSADRLR